MTLVTITPDVIRAYHHAGRTPVCVAVSAIVQTAARILEAGKALDYAEIDREVPRYEIKAAIGDFAGNDVSPDERQLIARQRAGRMAFVQAVFDGVAASLSELALLQPAALEVRDQRFRPYPADVTERMLSRAAGTVVAG